MTDKLDLTSLDIVNENVKKIAELFPNCFTETANGKAIDFDLLKQELNHEVIEGNKERYRLEWPGKREAIVTANLPTTKTLRPVREDSVDFDNTQNLYIEGDNLEVLKLLQESYLGKIKVMCIDPPYNTGKDFVYKDNFTQNSEEFKEESGQKDEYNQRLVVNPDSSGRYHSDWLTMMYPRLKLARNLLSDDGIIFINIDDNEVHNLRKICDDIFGENNFIASLVWANKEGGGSSDSKNFRIKHESILVYSKNITEIEIAGTDISNRDRYKQSDEFVDVRGPYYLQKLGMGSIQYSESLDYPIETPDKTVVYPKDNNGGKKACWRWSKKKFDWGVENKFIEINKDSQGIWTVYTKQYLNCDNEGNLIVRTQQPLGVIDLFSSTQASKFLDSIKMGNYFNYSKPYELISFLIERGIRSFKENEIILDFFSGSATTAQAVLSLNAKNKGNLKFILVQLPENTDEKSDAYKNGYKTICDLGKERIRKVGQLIEEELKQKQTIEESELKLETEEIYKVDIGFRVYRLSDSNMKDVYYRPQDFKQEQLDAFTDNIKPDRTADDLLIQIMLDWGLPLSLKIEQLNIDKKQVFKVAENSLLACFDNGLNEAFAKEIAKIKPLRVVFKDSSFADNSEKENVKQLLKQLSPETEMKVI
jgi:adenine-specific DNA-methyltransferase